MKLIEYLAPISASAQRARILATMYYLEVIAQQESFTTTEIRAALAEARTPNIKNWNIAATLAKAGANVHSSDGSKAGKKWELTDTGRGWVKSFAPIEISPALEHKRKSEAGALRAHVSKIKDDEARAFASEAVDCLEIGAHRAAIVFMWVAAVHEIQERIWSASSPASITTAAQSHNPKAKVCKKRDDLSEYNEDLLLQIAQDVGVLDKNQKAELVKALGLRNGSGHPNKLRPGEHRAKAHIEDIITMLF